MINFVTRDMPDSATRLSTSRMAALLEQKLSCLNNVLTGGEIYVFPSREHDSRQTIAPTDEN